MATLEVTSDGTKGPGTLSYALAHAGAGDTITFANTLSGTTGNVIDLKSTVDIKSSLTGVTIDDSAGNVTLNAQGGFTVLEVDAGASATIEGLTIENGVGTGTASSNPGIVGGSAAGGIYDMGSVTLANDTFLNDEATGGAGANATLFGQGGGAGGAAAGAIYVASGGSADIASSVTFTKDSATGGHGGYGAGGTYYGGGTAYLTSSGSKYAPQGSGSGGAGGYAKSDDFSSSPVPGATSQGYSQGNQGMYGAGQYGGQGGNSGQQGLGNTYLYNSVDVTGAAGGGGGGAAYADFGGAGTITCYLRGTAILTPGGPVAVEDLRIGDPVLTGLADEVMTVKWIGRSTYAGWSAESNDDLQPIQFKVGSIADKVPGRDLFVSPEHAMFIDGVLVPSRNLINGISIVRAAPMDEVSYFHIELDRHALLLAEGALSESFIDDNSRDMFQNAPEYAAMYPSAVITTVAEFCAPRVEDGYKLEDVRRMLMSRAVRLLPDGTAGQDRVLDSNIDFVSRTLIEGWAYLPESPDVRVVLAIVDNGAMIGKVVADRHRIDLKNAGIGDGRHGFSFAIPSGLSDAVSHEIAIHRVSDWSLVHGAPVILGAEILDIVPAYAGGSASEPPPVLLV